MKRVWPPTSSGLADLAVEERDGLAEDRRAGDALDVRESVDGLGRGVGSVGLVNLRTMRPVFTVDDADG